MGNFKKWISNQKYNVGLVLFLLVLIFMFLYLKKLPNEELGKLYNITQIIGIFVTIVGVIIAVRQYVQTSQNEIIKFENDQVRKSIELAEYYKNNILNNMVIIKNVYRISGISDILDNIKEHEMINFDTHELEKLLTKDNQKKLKDIIGSNEFNATVAAIGKYYDLDVFEEYIDANGNSVKKISKNKVHELFKNNTVLSTLNNLEYFAMHFTHDTADESVVYQSLHKTYLSVVQTLYYDIAKNNKYPDKKLYTNVIELFNIWQARSIEIKDKTVTLSRSATQSGKKAKHM